MMKNTVKAMILKAREQMKANDLRKPNRKWFKKKRVIIPVILFSLAITNSKSYKAEQEAQKLESQARQEQAEKNYEAKMAKYNEDKKKAEQVELDKQNSEQYKVKQREMFAKLLIEIETIENPAVKANKNYAEAIQGNDSLLIYSSAKIAKGQNWETSKQLEALKVDKTVFTEEQVKEINAMIKDLQSQYEQLWFAMGDILKYLDKHQMKYLDSAKTSQEQAHSYQNKAITRKALIEGKLGIEN